MPRQHVVVDGTAAVLALAVGALVQQGEGTLHVGELLLDRVQQRPVDVELARDTLARDTLDLETLVVETVVVETLVELVTNSVSTAISPVATAGSSVTPATSSVTTAASS